MSSSDDGGCIALILIVALIIAVAVAIILVMYYVAMGFVIAGGVYGGYKSVENYSKSFDKNILGGKIWKSNRQK